LIQQGIHAAHARGLQCAALVVLQAQRGVVGKLHDEFALFGGVLVKPVNLHHLVFVVSVLGKALEAA
jgi:hypothetical protein